jgi:O-antigen ligase
VADQPDGIVLTRHRDLRDRDWHPWLRRGLVGLLALVVLLALFGFVGQHPSTTRAEASAATQGVNTPNSVRGGLL